MPEVHVLITSAPWRRDSLRSCLDALAQQTLAPTSVLLVLDGETSSDADAWLDSVPLEAFAEFVVERRQHGRGPGARWEHRGLASIPRDAIIATLDDDIAPAPDYLERTVALVLDRNAVITWHGWRGAIELGGMHAAPPEDLDVVAFGTGCAAYRKRWIDWLRLHPLATSYLTVGPKSDDDALLALYLYERGVRVIRPAGPAPLRELPASRADDAGFRRHGDYRHGARLALSMLFDAPLCSQHFPPPEPVVAHYAKAVRSIREQALHIASAEGPARAALHRAMSRWPDPFWAQLSDLLYALPEGASVLEVEFGPWSRWLELYCLTRGIRLDSVGTHEPVYNAVRARRVHGHMHRAGAALSGLHFDLQIVAPYRDPMTNVIAPTTARLR